jgi:hypothetical protein
MQELRQEETGRPAANNGYLCAQSEGLRAKLAAGSL